MPPNWGLGAHGALAEDPRAGCKVAGVLGYEPMARQEHGGLACGLMGRRRLLISSDSWCEGEKR